MRLRLALATVLLPGVLAAQQTDSTDGTVTLRGRVLDEVDSGAVAHATVDIVGTTLTTRTDGWGNFSIGGVRPGPHDLVIRALGYAKLTQSADVVAGTAQVRRDFYMTKAPQLLTEMVVLGRAMRVPHGFEEIYRRGARGWGTFITREQIDSLDPIDLRTMLATIPGVFVNDRSVYFPRCPTGWSPQLWLDGQRMTRFDTLNVYMSEILPAEVQAMEVYRSIATTPAEYLDGSGCGVIAIWTKRGP